MDERFSRIERMIGQAGLQKLACSYVAVIGLGAVGSYAVEGLARAGVGRLRLVDFDKVQPSNINRQLYALESTLGQAKCDLAAQRVNLINPDCRTEAINAFVHRETLDPVLDGPPDLVIDAIDSFNPKVELLLALTLRQIPTISCMGAALRTDPTLVRTGPLSAVHHCPLASKVRKKLRQAGVATNFTCVYSIEPVKNLPPGVIGPEEPESCTSLERGRTRRPLGSLPTLTGIFGLTAANSALQILLKESFPTKMNNS
ncbi:MAG: tRNA threonylcarbamoyladenosine dehydratase [Phycisphaerae bacterium]|jgi:tRNA A37 threonylcarbamoyladenosine dehydratase|nr:tRNA threonylcarbamoyladenosine dehydratase [Phycisphaerae bacterium]